MPTFELEYGKMFAESMILGKSALNGNDDIHFQQAMLMRRTGQEMGGWEKKMTVCQSLMRGKNVSWVKDASIGSKRYTKSLLFFCLSMCNGCKYLFPLSCFGNAQRLIRFMIPMVCFFYSVAKKTNIERKSFRSAVAWWIPGNFI